jgi:hypothetical protein
MSSATTVSAVPDQKALQGNGFRGTYLGVRACSPGGTF